MAEQEYKFVREQFDCLENRADDERLALLACCVADQQRAGFGATLDIREAECPNCAAPGFNTGWGFWRFSCGAEILADGEHSADCRRVPAEPPAA